MQQNPNSNSVLCVICYSPIIIGQFGQGSVIERDYVGCPSGHIVHRNCLKQWILKNKTCPVCHSPYDLNVINIFNSYIEQMKKDQQDAEAKKQMLVEQQSQLKKDFPRIDPEIEDKFTRSERLFKEGNNTAAMNILWDIIDTNSPNPKDPAHLRALLELSKIYSTQGQHALAVTQLMKIVKADFKYPLGFYFLGINYEALGLPDKAKWAYERAVPNLQALEKENSQYGEYRKQAEERMKKCFC